MISQGQIAETARLEGVLEGAATRPAQSFWSESWERLRANRAGLVAAAVIVFMGLVALAAPLLSALVTHRFWYRVLVCNLLIGLAFERSAFQYACQLHVIARWETPDLHVGHSAGATDAARDHDCMNMITANTHQVHRRSLE